MRKVLGTVAALLVSAMGVCIAEAHPRLLSASPAMGARVQAPGHVRLRFSERLIPGFCKLALVDRKGHQIPLRNVVVSADRKQLGAQIPIKLRAGIYQLTWRVVSTDTHRVQANYTFAVVS